MAKAKESTPLVSGADAAAGGSADAELLGTVVSISGLIGVNVIKVQLTAHLFETAGYPTAYSFWSAICTIILLIPLFICKRSLFGMPTLAMLPILSAVVMFTTLDMAFQNIALSSVSTALVMCIMGTVPFWTSLFETILYCKVQHGLIYITVSFLVLGAVLVALASPITRASTLGTVFACLAVLCSASKAVFTHDTFKQYKKVMSPPALLFWIDVMMLPIFIPWTVANGEMMEMFDDITNDAHAFGMLTFVASLGGVRALLGFYVLSYVTATSSAVVNIFTQDCNILISLPIQAGTSRAIPIGPELIGGISSSMGASAFYTFIKIYKPILKAVPDCCSCAKRAPSEGASAS